MDALVLHRIQFAFTITFHYLFPQLTMGLALLILILMSGAVVTGAFTMTATGAFYLLESRFVDYGRIFLKTGVLAGLICSALQVFPTGDLQGKYMKTIGIMPNRAAYNDAARFWGRIFAVNFIMGVVTGIPMEFQFGTNWSQFSRATGSVIGQPLAMEGVFSFFLESAFLGLFLFGERRLSKWGHWWAGFLVFLGSWLSGFFIIVADAWMQHPVAYRALPNGVFELTSFAALLLNPWALLQFAHNAEHQPATTAAMEALFKTETGAPLVILGQPDEELQRIDNPIVLNRVLSFLIYGTTSAEVRGLNEFPRDQWPTNIPLLYYSYHIMAGLGTYFIGVMAMAAFLLMRGQVFTSRWILWPLMLSFPLPYIANTAGWMTAELGRQPWLIYGLMRTEVGFSSHVSAGNTLFTLLGFMGLYSVLSILFVILVYREIIRGPGQSASMNLESSLPLTVA